MTIVYITIRLLNLLQWLLVFRALASWFPQVQQSRIGELLYTITEPMIAPFRSILDRFQSSRTMMLDFSPLLAFLVLLILEQLLRAMLLGLY
ncbi:MAG: YggT family protein [Eubacteriales bacterium]|nr:YggT family protein [Eubacteriales bacterium]